MWTRAGRVVLPYAGRPSEPEAEGNYRDLTPRRNHENRNLEMN